MRALSAAIRRAGAPLVGVAVIALAIVAIASGRPASAVPGNPTSDDGRIPAPELPMGNVNIPVSPIPPINVAPPTPQTPPTDCAPLEAPADVQLTPGVAGQDTVCVRTGHLVHRITLASHNIQRGEYVQSLFTVRPEPCGDLSLVAEGTREPIPASGRVIDGVRISYTHPGRPQANTPITVHVEDFRKRLSTDRVEQLWADGPIAFLPADGGRPPVYVRLRNVANALTRLRSRTIQLVPEFAVCAVEDERGPAAIRARRTMSVGVDLPTTQLLNDVPLFMTVNDYMFRSRPIGRNRSEQIRRADLVLKTTTPAIQSNVGISAITRQSVGNNVTPRHYDVTICNDGAAPVTSDVTLRGDIRGSNVAAVPVRETLGGGLPPQSCRTITLRDVLQRVRLATTVALTVVSHGDRDESTNNNALNVTFPRP